MTEFKSYPDMVVTMPEDGKVTGVFRMWTRGDGSIGARTDAHINDDKVALTYRGEDYLIHYEYKRVDGEVVDNADTAWRGKATRRSTWSDAPPSYDAAIREAVGRAIAEHWTPEFEREGLEADVAQNLSSLEREERETAAKLRDLRKQIKAQHKRL